jgi:hypothetical protein
MEDKRPKVITLNNLKFYFNYKLVSPRGGIQPGMLLEFNYNSPAGVHDRKPLIYVLQVENDRVYGLNLHYKFDLITQIITTKKQEIATIVANMQTTKKEVSKEIPNVATAQEEIGQIDISKIKFNSSVLEKYSLTTQPSHILRNYLYSRMTSSYKLVYKPI